METSEFITFRGGFEATSLNFNDKVAACDFLGP